MISIFIIVSSNRVELHSAGETTSVGGEERGLGLGRPGVSGGAVGVRPLVGVYQHLQSSLLW